MLRVRLPFPPRRRLRGPAEALSPEPPPLVPKAPPQGPPRGSAEAPESRSASPLLTAEYRRADSPSPAPRPPSSAPRSCHPAAALPRALGLSPPAPRAARARREARAGAPVLTPPQERRCPPQDERTPGRRRKSLRVGVCGRARTRCPGARCLQPRPNPALGSAVPAPAAVAPGASRTRPLPRLPSPPRCGPIPAPTSAVVAPTSQVTAADKPGRALHAAPRGPLPATHTRRPPGAASFQARGPRASIPGRREQRGGRRGGRHPPSQPPSARRRAARLLPGPAPGTHCARAHRAHLPAVCRIRPGGGGVGAARLVRSASSARCTPGLGVVARCLEEPSPSSPTSDSPAGQRQQRPRWAGRFENVKFCWPTGPLPVCPQLLGTPPLVCFSWELAWVVNSLATLVLNAY